MTMISLLFYAGALGADELADDLQKFLKQEQFVRECLASPNARTARGRPPRTLATGGRPV